MIKVDNLCKWYGSNLAVDHVSFNVTKGEVLAFIGPNGAGKSTTMRIITGFIPASGGKVTIDKFDIEENPIEAKAKIGYLPENAPLYGNMSVNGFLNFTAEIRGFSGAEKKKRIDEAIQKCFLEPVVYQSIDTLSKGYRHRTCFAQAIIHDPEILILDEPTDGLDPNQKREVRNLIKEMGQNKAIIISTHILEEVEAVASRVVLINKGKKGFDGTPKEFKDQSTMAGTILVQVLGGESDKVASSLRSLPSVDKTEIANQDEKAVSVRVFPAKSADHGEIRKHILEAFNKEKWGLGEIKEDTGRLEEVFYKLTVAIDEKEAE